MSITTTIEQVTPALAEVYLRRNFNNRNISRVTVSYYAREMAKGAWKLNGESIKFDEYDNLIDGQHRLLAVIESGATILTIVLRGLDNDSFSTLDCGRTRNAGQVLGTKGILNANNMAAICKKVHMLKKNLVLSRDSSKVIRISNTDVMNDVLKNLCKYEESYTLACQLYHKFPMGYTLGEIGAIYYFLVYCKNHPNDKVKTFLSSLFSYEKSEYPTIEYLRNRLIRLANSSATHLTQEYKTNIIAKAWNNFITNKNVKAINWDKEKEGKVAFL